MARIEAVEVFRVNLPLRKPMKLAANVSNVAQNVLGASPPRRACCWGEAASHRP